MKLKKILWGLKSKFFNDTINFEQASICKVNLKTVKGTVRKMVDIDDAWFFQLAKNNDIIFDIGANIGYTGLLAMIQNPNRRYVFVDPNPLALADASKNMILNNFGRNASFFPAFVSNKAGSQVKFYTVGTGAAGSMFKSHAATAAKLNNWFYVETTTLDALVNYYETIPDLIKVDVEGAENYVLNGAVDVCKKQSVTFFVEMHALKEVPMIENAQMILNWCQNQKYEAWYMKEAIKMENPELIVGRGRCHLLLVPKGKPYPYYLKNIKQGDALPISLNDDI